MERLSEALGLVPGNPLRPFTLGLLVILGLAAMFAAVVAAFAPFWALIAAIIAAAVLISLLVIVPFARRYVREMRRLLAGEAWVRWHLDPEEWERFSAQELARSRREAMIGAGVSAILAIMIGLIAAASGGSGAATLLAGGWCSRSAGWWRSASWRRVAPAMRVAGMKPAWSRLALWGFTIRVAICPLPDSICGPIRSRWSPGRR
ncbi:MAG: hypothetical protein M3354_05885 [Chloroflexota bacterium]|nr:hypothetical protein [Chloroflexota bacterium]